VVKNWARNALKMFWRELRRIGGRFAIPGEFWGFPGQHESAPVIRPPAPAPFDPGARGIGYSDPDIRFKN